MRTLYRAGAVHTLTGSAATALVVDGERITWLGSDQADPSVRRRVDSVVDLDGALITAGFVDAHVHVTETGLMLTGLDLRAARSVPQILAMVEGAARAGGGRPVLGHGWDEARLAERRPPTRPELDRASAGGVVYLSRVDVHSAVISSALAAASRASSLPGWAEDGRVERDAHHAARDAVRETLSPSARRAAQLIALRAAAAAGIVSVHEMSAPHIAPEEDLQALLALVADAEQALPQVIAYRGALVTDEAEARALLDRLSVPVAGLAGDLCVDGSIGSRTAAFLAPYDDAPAHAGHLYLTVDQIRDHVAACTRIGLQAGFHVIGDAAVDRALRGIRRAAERVGIAAVRAARHRLEHVEAIDAEGIAEMADLGVTASVQPAFDALWGGVDGMYARRLGPDRAAATNPVAALLAAGVLVAFGSDSPVTPFDPWGAVRASMNHHVAAQRISGAAALRAHTASTAGAPTASTAAADAGDGDLRIGAPATFAAWASPGGRPTPGGLPDLGAGEPSPTCLLTVGRGRILHDGR